MKTQSTKNRAHLGALIVSLVVVGLIVGVSYFGSGKSISSAFSKEKIIYIATNGNDNSDGSSSSPIRTFQRASELIQGFPTVTVAVLGPQFELEDSTLYLSGSTQVRLTSASSSRPSKLIRGNSEKLRVLAEGGSLDLSNLGFSDVFVSLEAGSPDSSQPVRYYVSKTVFDSSINGGDLLSVRAFQKSTVSIQNSTFRVVPRKTNSLMSKAVELIGNRNGRINFGSNQLIYSGSNEPQRLVGLSVASMESSAVQVTGNVFRSEGECPVRNNWANIDPLTIGILASTPNVSSRFYRNDFSCLGGQDLMFLADPTSSQNLYVSGNRG